MDEEKVWAVRCFVYEWFAREAEHPGLSTSPTASKWLPRTPRER
jgi:hypothetical protein